jgi:protein-tyrosine phosphatase
MYHHAVDDLIPAVDFMNNIEMCEVTTYINEKISISGYWTTLREDEMKGFESVIRLYSENNLKEYPKYDHIKYLEICIEDGPENIRKYFNRCINFIDNSEGRVLVHCTAGVSRSSTIVLAYLTYKGTPLYKNLKLLREKRPVVDPNECFMKQLIRFEEDINMKKIQI